MLWFAVTGAVLFFRGRANLEVLQSAASDEVMHLNPFAALADSNPSFCSAVSFLTFGDDKAHIKLESKQ